MEFIVDGVFFIAKLGTKGLRVKACFGFDIARRGSHSEKVRLSIVTPSFRSSAWLKLCIASVADQRAGVEHIVQDSESDDGTQEWLRRDTRVKAYIEKDRGMYDALNRGFQRAQGGICGYLNADEQYLAGALNRVADFFQSRPEIDVLFGDVVIVNETGNYLCHRKMQPPRKYHTWTCHLSTLSCGMFFRRQLFSQRGFHFNPLLRDVGDGEWVLRLLRAGVKMAVLGAFTSVFTVTGQNMSVGSNAKRENRELRRSAPVWVQGLRPLVILHHRLMRWLGGMYRQKPFSYSIYTRQSPGQRQLFEVSNPAFRMPT